MAGLREGAVAQRFWDLAGKEATSAAGRATRPEAKRRHNGAGPAPAGLVRAIETEVIPRLVLARRAIPDGAAVPVNGVVAPTADDVAEFTHLVLGRDETRAWSFVPELPS